MVPWARLAFGSCNSVHNMWCPDLTKECKYLPQPLWPHVVAREPQAWIWMGDAIYADYIEGLADVSEPKAATPERIRELYRRQAQNDGYKALVNSGVRIIGTWDDHDMGMNNADQSYAHLAESAQAFRVFIGGDFPNEGMYTNHRFNLNGVDTHVILLDVRSFRTSYQDSNGNFLGEKQWRWLDARLREKADLVIVGSSIQVMPQHRVSIDVEGWENFPHQRSRLLKRLAVVDSTYVPLIMSGDVHFADIWDAGCVMELTSSGLTHSTGDSRHILGAESGFMFQELWAMYAHPLHHRFQVALNMFLQPYSKFSAMEQNFGEISVERGEVRINVHGQSGMLKSLMVPNKTANTTCSFPKPLPAWNVLLNISFIFLYTSAPVIAVCIFVGMLLSIGRKLTFMIRICLSSFLVPILMPQVFSIILFGPALLFLFAPLSTLMVVGIGCLAFVVAKKNIIQKHLAFLQDMRMLRI